MNHELINKIKRTGLSDKEARIYAFLLESGGAFPSKISSETKINRSTVYKNLTLLTIKGLVNEIEKKNKLFYQIDKPKKLIQHAEGQAKMTATNLDYVKKIFPELEIMFSSTPSKPKVKFFEGPEAIEIICDEVTSEKNYEMLGLSNAEKFKNAYNNKLLSEFVRKKAKNNIGTRGIMIDTPENRKYSPEVFKNVDKKYWPVIKYTDKSIVPFDGEITMFEKNKVSIAKLEDQSIFAVLIEDAVIYKMMRTFFDIAWESTLLK